ncbi:excisionase [Paraburkholderia kirstenboschensis]|uniref:Excisionase n=1 Tax=Paraburkholderia kirstenboschensis TaxID=1245436 RepID=A0ABZ0EQJ9_9BURK|nr:excisionase [Paraburkholderia kirstenboschensis]WOD18654.1 excisionase [Paraburkholderia kirstenboschensis]
MAAQLIPLSVWAESIFGEHKPHRNTLMNWIRNGRIRPVPRKVGREYFCKPNAEYVDPVAERIERMTNGR